MKPPVAGDGVLSSPVTHRQPLTPSQLWARLPETCRFKTLQSLSRIVAQQLYRLPGGQEVRHEANCEPYGLYEPVVSTAPVTQPVAYPTRVYPGGMKIQAVHVTKLAMVYVRQSTPQQVLGNRESTTRQYALADYGSALGWPRDRVVIVDEDQGQSGASATHRAGFQQLLAEVTLDHVGLILGLEMSRLARSSKDWHHLLEVCALFGTLLADQDGVYDACDPNDRLLLGLKIPSIYNTNFTYSLSAAPSAAPASRDSG